MTKENFDYLVSVLTIARESGAFKGLSFNVNRKTHGWSFSKEPLDGCLIIEDWERYYLFDAAEDYVNPSEFVAECLIEEASNRLELEEAYDEIIKELIEKHK